MKIERKELLLKHIHRKLREIRATPYSVRLRLAAAFALQMPLWIIYNAFAASGHIPSQGPLYGLATAAVAVFIIVTLLPVFRDGQPRQKVLGGVLVGLPGISLFIVLFWRLSTL